MKSNHLGEHPFLQHAFGTKVVRNYLKRKLLYSNLTIQLIHLVYEDSVEQIGLMSGELLQRSFKGLFRQWLHSKRLISPICSNVPLKAVSHKAFSMMTFNELIVN